MTEPQLCELSVDGRQGVRFPEPDVPETVLPTQFLRHELPLPELSEVDVVRHFTRLSQLNYGIDLGFYPLGSCTMKYNPKSMKKLAACQDSPLCTPSTPSKLCKAAWRSCTPCRNG